MEKEKKNIEMQMEVTKWQIFRANYKNALFTSDLFWCCYLS